MKKWFTIEHIDEKTHIISEYRHWEETHCYLLCGDKSSLLIDTGLGIENIYDEVIKLTDKPVIAVATHIHWDHIGGHKYFPNFYAHKEELDWLQGGFPLSMEKIKDFVIEDCDLPEGYDVESYEFFQGIPTKLLNDNDIIDIGGRKIRVLHTPGHSPGHLCFFEEESGYLFTGDLIYMGMLLAYYPSTDPEAYLRSIDKLLALPYKTVFPAHHSIDVPETIITDMKNALQDLQSQNKLKHGMGIIDLGYFSIWL